MADDPEKTQAELDAEAAQKAVENIATLARCKEERRVAKEAMLARNAARIADLQARGLLKERETLEQYDDRIAAEKKASGR